MTPAAGRLFVWAENNLACIRVTGRATLALSVDFRGLWRHLVQSGHTRLLLDLSGCQAMDSTFLGVLAHETQRLTTPGASAPPKPALVNARESIRATFEELGIARLFDFVQYDLDQRPFTDAGSGTAPARETLTRTSLEAHEALMALHPANQARFKDVARFLAAELDPSRSSGAP